MPDNLYLRKGVWYARAFVRGQEIRESLRTTDKKEARRRLKPWLQRISARRFGEDRHSWEEATGKYLTEVAPTALAASTQKRYEVSFRAVAQFLEGRFLDEITRKLLGKIASRSGVSNATRRRDLTAVSVVLDAAEAWAWIDEAPAIKRKHLRERREPIVLPEPEEIDRFAATCHAYRFNGGEAGTLGHLVEFLLHSGMRLEEAAGLMRPQVGGRGRVATLYRTKTVRARAVMLSAQATGTLNRCPVRLGCPLVFWWGDGQRYETASHLLSRIRKAEGIAWVTHDLRHRYAVDYLRRGIERLRTGLPYDPHEGGSIYDLKKQLGHSSVATTEIYLDFLTAEEQDLSRRGALAR